MYYLGSISGASGAAYNWSGGVSGFANFRVPAGVKALYLEPSASGLRFALSAATGYTGFLGTGAGLGAAIMQNVALHGPYRRLGDNCSVGIYSAGATQYSVRVFGAPTS
jgi:hypothetical protein